MRCAGKTALITGGSGSGMGRSIALTLAREGANIAVNYLSNETAARETAARIEKIGAKSICVQGDVFQADDCQRLVEQAVRAFGQVDICIIGPGAGWNPEKPDKLNPESALDDVRREVSPVYNLMPLLLTDMAQRRWGRIIGLASNPDLPSPAYSYNVSKAARIQALKQAAKDAWKFGVTVNILAPGPVEPFASLDEATEACMKGIRSGKVTPQDIAEAAAFLCADGAGYLTGSVLSFQF